MTEIEYRVADLINFSSNQKPVDFGDAFKSIITDKVAAAIETKKTEIAQSMFNPVQAQDSDIEDDDTEIEHEVESEEEVDA